MLVPERLTYPSSIFGYAFSLESTPDIDLIVEAELPRRAKSDRSSVMLFRRLVKLPYRLEPGFTDGRGCLQSLSGWELAHCHAISGPLLPPSANSAICRGGGSGGGTGSLAFGIAIGPEEVAGEEEELYELDMLEDLKRSEGCES